MKPPPEEFEAAIDEIDSPEAETAAGALLKSLPGIWASAVALGSVWVSFDPSVTGCATICRKLRLAGFSPRITLVNGQHAKC